MKVVLIATQALHAHIMQVQLKVQVRGVQSQSTSNSRVLTVLVPEISPCDDVCLVFLR